jgi:hypothetical protein
MIPLKINNKSLYEIFDPDTFDPTWNEDTLIAKSLRAQMFPSEVALTSETYSRDAERTADYELENLTIVNRKAKPEFTWGLIRASYVANLFAFLEYSYNFKNDNDVVIPVEAPTYTISYRDFIGERTISAYLGQTIEGVLVEYDGVLYWSNFRIAFPER